MVNKAEQRRQWMLMGCFFLILLALHVLFVRTGTNDDLVYQGYWRDYSLGAFLKLQYETWTSRLLIEIAVMLCTGAPVWVWHLLNILMVLGIVWNVADLFGLGDRWDALVLFFTIMWAVPLDTLCDAGWINTSVNYLWILSAGLAALRPLKHLCCGEHCARWELAVCPACALFAADMEQMAAVLLGSYLVCGGYLLMKKRKLSPIYFVQLALILLSILFALTAPGNGLRFEVEARNEFPRFPELGVGEKLVMGWLETAQYYFAAGYQQKCAVFPLLAGVLFLGVLTRCREGERLWRLPIAAFPLAFYWGIGQLGNRLLAQGLVPRGGHVIGLLGGNCKLPGPGAYSWGQVSFQIVIYLLILACVAASVFFLHGKSTETLLELTILGAGFCSRILMGFSPTVYASGDRTALYCSAAILIVTMRNILLILKQKS